MKFGLILLISIFSNSIYCQTDNLSRQALDFAKYIFLEDDTSEIHTFLTDSIINKKTSDQIDLIRNLEITGQINFHIMRAHADKPLFNVNVYNRVTKDEYGDVRILFENEDDLLIDQWLYLKPNKIEDRSDYQGDIPPPPPPPGK